MTDTAPTTATTATTHFSRVSVIVPVRPGGSVGECLEGIQAWDFPVTNVEMLVAEGQSPAKQRNQAAAKATGDLLVFLDNDSKPRQDWLQRIDAAFQAFPDAVGVGGPNVTPATDTFWQHAFGCALGSQFAHASMACRYRPIGERREAGEKELILCGMAVKRETFDEVGGFDETLFPNEENEFMNRLTRGGRTLVYDPEVRVERSRRRNVWGFMKQMAKYGRGRMEQTFVEEFHPGNVFFLAPLVFTLLLVVLLVFPSPVTVFPLVVYLAGAFISSIGFAKMLQRPQLDLVLPVLYIIMHVAYSVGLVTGLVKRLRHGSAPYHPGPVTVRTLKEFDQPWTT